MRNACLFRLVVVAFVSAGVLSTRSRADTVYVVNSGNNSVEQYSSSGAASVFANTGLNAPQGLAFDAAGNLYVSNQNDNTIVKFTPSGVFDSVFATTDLNGPEGLAFDGAGNLFAANSFSNTIVKFAPNGVSSIFANTGLAGPTGLAFDSGGNLYVTNEFNDTIVKFTPSGVSSIFANTGLNPYGLAFDGAGNLYVANDGDNTIEKFTPAGVASVFASTGLLNPVGLAFDSAGNLYAANIGDFGGNPPASIEKFTPDGAPSVFATSGLNRPSFVAILPGALPTPAPTATAKLLNISTRAQVLTGDNVLIGGFIITGANASTPKKVVIRAIGPSLSNATPPVPGVLADPVLELHQTVGGIDAILASNDNWKTNSAADQMTITGDGFDKLAGMPISDLESIIVATLPSRDPNVIGSGAYTAIVHGQGGATGVALVEVYDLDDPTTTTTELANISTRGLVGTGDNVMIGGIIVGPAANGGEVIVRAMGPSLADAGITDPLLDPTLTLFDANGDALASNDNWMDSPDKQTIIDDQLAPTNDAESALLATLPAGAYTAIVSGVGGTTGVGLVEAYHIPAPAAKQ